MTGPATPGQEGPSFAPPPLPEGWIAQWDGMGRKYYFVQRSTGTSQWELPTHPAPTVGTPTATPGQETSPFPRPEQHQDEMGQRVGQHEIEGEQVGPDGERGFTSMAMDQLLHSGGKKPSNKQSSPLVSLADSLLGGGSHSQNGHSSNTGSGGLVGSLAGSLLGSGKSNQNQQQPPQQQHSNYSGSQSHGGYGQQQGAGGLMGKVGGMFGGSTGGQQSNQYGYSQSGSQQGGYTGQAPPTSYQPVAPQSSYGQQSSQQVPHGTSGGSSASSYYNPSPPSYGGGAQQQQSPAYGSSTQQPSYGSPQQPPYGSPQQPSYGSAQQSPFNNHSYSQQPGYGAPIQQPVYGVPPQHQQQYPSSSNYSSGPPQQQQPPYGSGAYGGMPARNPAQPQHHHFQGMHNVLHQGGLYGNGDQPQPPVGSHPSHGAGYSGSGLGGYSEMQGSGRW